VQLGQLRQEWREWVWLVELRGRRPVVEQRQTQVEVGVRGLRERLGEDVDNNVGVVEVRVELVPVRMSVGGEGDGGRRTVSGWRGWRGSHIPTINIHECLKAVISRLSDALDFGSGGTGSPRGYSRSRDCSDDVRARRRFRPRAHFSRREVGGRGEGRGLFGAGHVTDVPPSPTRDARSGMASSSPEPDDTAHDGYITRSDELADAIEEDADVPMSTPAPDADEPQPESELAETPAYLDGSLDAVGERLVSDTDQYSPETPPVVIPTTIRTVEESHGEEPLSAVNDL
jgi:hypothetical protein